MTVPFPEPHWPVALSEEEGPAEDPEILLTGAAEIGNARHRILAVRINPQHLRADFRADLEADVYADYPVQVMLDELTFFDNIDRSTIVPLAGGSYVIWMVPSGSRQSDSGRSFA